MTPKVEDPDVGEPRSTLARDANGFGLQSDSALLAGFELQEVNTPF